MKHTVQFVVLFCLHVHQIHSAKLPGPLVYVVTPSSNPLQPDAARASPFYYHNWMRRMDTPEATSTTTTTQKTPDLIFAEFESGNNNVKSIRKLLEKEKTQVKTTTTTTSRPIYVPDEEAEAGNSNYGIPETTTEKQHKTDMIDYFALYNNLNGGGSKYVPSAPSSSEPYTPKTTTTTTTTTTTQAPVNNMQNIWHIIDSQKHDQFAGTWKEESANDVSSETNENILNDNQTEGGENIGEENIDENFAVPGFGTNPGNGGENESRAIRTEPNIRFPYVNLKPFKMKNFNSKKLNNMFNLDSFTEIKNPVRGEVQETHMVPIQQASDRYNPAQPYLPSYGTKSKDSSGPSPSVPSAPPSLPPSKVTANLVPPPPPPAPQITDDDFPTPRTYESFPPYALGGSDGDSTFSFPPSAASGADSPSPTDDSVPSSGYRYKTPSLPTAPAMPKPPASAFRPTLPPISKPFSGYSYDKPQMKPEDTLPPMDMDDKPDFQGYQYNKPAPPSPPSQPSPTYQQDYSAPSFEHHDASPPHHSGPDYPDLIFDKPHGLKDMKGGDSDQGNDMGMMPPPADDIKPDSYVPPMDDHGFPHDFPGSFKYAHDFDDHDFHHYHHHHPTTSTTEQPRVNRFSYYYLGKKLYYLPLYFSVYFIVYVGALIIKAVLRHKITYPNSFRPNGTTATFFSKRSIEAHLTNDNLHEITGRVTKAIATAAEKYISDKSKEI